MNLVVQKIYRQIAISRTESSNSKLQDTLDLSKNRNFDRSFLTASTQGG